MKSFIYILGVAFVTNSCAMPDREEPCITCEVFPGIKECLRSFEAANNRYEKPDNGF